MANTYSQIHIQIVFAIKNRYSPIKATEREKVEKYICGIISNNKCKPLAIYCNPDHVHILIGLNDQGGAATQLRRCGMFIFPGACEPRLQRFPPYGRADACLHRYYQINPVNPVRH